MDENVENQDTLKNKKNDFQKQIYSKKNHTRLQSLKIL